MKKRLFIDLDICNECPECRVSCRYFYHPQNNGVTSLREYATFALFCRHCEEAPCVNSCYRAALEKQPDGILKRHKMRCTSCKSCSIACPFGTILEDFIPYLDSSCDYCIGISQKLPACLLSCPGKAISLLEADADRPAEGIFLVGDNLAVRSYKWLREDALKKK